MSLGKAVRRISVAQRAEKLLDSQNGRDIAVFSGEWNIAPPSVSQTSQGILTTQKCLPPSVCVQYADVRSEFKLQVVVHSALLCGNNAGFKLFRNLRKCHYSCT
jgi:hypothetical protein